MTSREEIDATNELQKLLAIDTKWEIRVTSMLLESHVKVRADASERILECQRRIAELTWQEKRIQELTSFLADGGGR